MKYLYIVIGGASGSLLRFVLADFITNKSNSAFPYGTFSVNLAGSLLIGFLFGLFSVNGQIDDKIRFLLMIGFLGGFTTFSSYALETMKLVQTAQISTALVYVIASNVFGIALAFAGYTLGLKLK